MENSTAWGRRETRGSINNVVTSDLALMCFYPSLPMSLSFSPPSPAAMPRCACKRRFPSVSPGHSQHDFPESVFDISRLLGVAQCVHTAVGRYGKSNQHTVTYVGHLSQMSQRTCNTSASTIICCSSLKLCLYILSLCIVHFLTPVLMH